MAAPDPRSFLPLTPLVSEVLLALVDQPRHGYGIILDVAQRTDGLIKMRTGTLYVLLQRLLDQDLIESLDSPPKRDDDSRRRYYGITPLGHAVLQAETKRLERIVADARRKRVLGRAGKA
jgi:DNA-binding PadR family transcriptional regulator